MNHRHVIIRFVSSPLLRRFSRLLLALSLLAVQFPSVARADHKIVPGSMCHGVEYGTLDFDAEQSSITATDSNEDGSPRRVVCPLIKDNAGALAPDLKVYVDNDNADGDQIECRLGQALPQTGTVVVHGTRSTSVMGPSVLDFSAVAAGADAFFTTHFVECDLPPDSRIRHISYEESADLNERDDKLFPGALCMPASTKNPANWLRYEESDGAGSLGTVLAAASPGIFHVVCPVARDWIAVPDGFQSFEVAVSDRQRAAIKDRDFPNRSIEVVCELFQHNALTGTATALAESQNLEQPDHQTGEASWGFRTFSMNYGLTNDVGMEYYYALHCSLPQKEDPTTSGGSECNSDQGSCLSSILSYRISEDLLESGGSGQRDWKNYSGAFCKHTPNALALGDATGYTTAGEIENPLGIPVTVTCPVLRDSIVGGSLDFAVVYVEDAHATEDVTCTFRSRRGDRDDLLLDDADTQSTTGTGRQALTFSVNGFGAGGTVGYYAIECDLPGNQGGGRSRVVSFGIKEFRPTQ